MDQVEVLRQNLAEECQVPFQVTRVSVLLREWHGGWVWWVGEVRRHSGGVGCFVWCLCCGKGCLFVFLPGSLQVEIFDEDHGFAHRKIPQTDESKANTLKSRQDTIQWILTHCKTWLFCFITVYFESFPESTMSFSWRLTVQNLADTTDAPRWKIDTDSPTRRYSHMV